MNHLQREDHFDDEQHQKNLQSLESEFNTNNAGPLKNIHLSVRPTSMYDCSKSPCAWASQASTRSADDATGRRASEDLWAKIAEDAEQFQRTYEADVQFIFSHVQHHWHLLNEKGERVPMKYCRPTRGKEELHL